MKPLKESQDFYGKSESEFLPDFYRFLNERKSIFLDDKRTNIGGIMKMGICVYCNEYKETTIWKETDERVCCDCRLDLLDQEFKEVE